MLARGHSEMTRKLVLSCYTSLDGVVQDPVGMENSGLGNWTGPFTRGPEGDRIMHEELAAADIVLLGRTTYEGFAAVWPSVDDPAGFARKMNSMRKYVASNTIYPTVLGRGTRLFPSDYASTLELTQIKPLGSGIVHAEYHFAHTGIAPTP